MSSSSSALTAQRLLTLKISTGEIFTIDAAAAAARFLSFKNMVEDCSTDTVIPVPNVDGEILAMVLKWCEKHSEEGDKKELKKWDADFVRDLDQALLYKLLMAADYLGGLELIDLLTQKVANMIKGKKAEQIRRTFNIQNDLTPEEEEAIRKKNAWAFY